MWIILLPHRFPEVLPFKKFNMLNFGSVTEEASWIHRFSKIRCHHKTKLKKWNSSKIERPRPTTLTKFNIKDHSVLVHLSTKIQLDQWKFAWIRHLWENSQKNQNLKKFKRFNRFWPNSIPKFLVWYIVYFGVGLGSSFRKNVATTPIFEKIENFMKIQIGHQLSCKTSFHSKIFLIAHNVFGLSHMNLLLIIVILTIIIKQ